MVCKTFAGVRVFRQESRDWLWAIPGMDVKPVGEGVSEMRIDYGPGYRVYYIKRERTMMILLAGGEKSTQAKDIKTAVRLARNL